MLTGRRHPTRGSHLALREARTVSGITILPPVTEPVTPRRRRVALLDWAHLIEDFLDRLQIPLEALPRERVSGWLFAYVEALKSAGLTTVWFCVSSRVTAPTRLVHQATGATIVILPSPRLYRIARRFVANPYADSVSKASSHLARLPAFAVAVLKHLMPYFCTPLRTLGREMRRERCDVLLCQEYEHGRFDAVTALGQLLRVPVFATFQGGDYHLSCFERFIRPLTLRAASGLIIASSTELERVHKKYGRSLPEIRQLFNPLDVRTWYREDRDQARRRIGIPTTARVAVWHGRVMIARKGLDVLIDAWERVCQRWDTRDLRLLLVGTGHDSATLKQRISDSHSRGIIWIDAFCTDPSTLRTYLSAADVYAFPSRHEGFPVAPVEAMACELPVVAADSSGVRDIFGDSDHHGGLIVPRDDAHMFASSLGKLLDDADYASELGQRARQRACQAFDVESIGPQLRTFMSDTGQ